MAIRSSSVGADTLWLDPADIRFKISPVEDLHGAAPGNWDIERRHELKASAKHRAIAERFIDGRRWEETDLFRDLYRRRFDEGGHIRGTRTIEALAAQYYDRVDGLYRSMKRDGFLIENSKGRAFPLPSLLIGRGGDVFLGNQGNHRLAIAQVLGLDRFAGGIVCRHS